jgi:hypothetical protein
MNDMCRVCGDVYTGKPNAVCRQCWFDVLPIQPKFDPMPHLDQHGNPLK